MKKAIFGGVAAAVLMALSSAAMANFVKDKDYTVLENPGKVDVPGKLEVREFFWYGCGHCFALEPHMQTWLKKIPKDVNFIRTPAAMNKIWEQNARGYYVSEQLGVRKRAHIPLFHQIHEKGQQLFDQKSLAKFYTKYGIPEAKFNSTFNSFAVSAKIAKSNQLAQQYQLTGVPAIVVNGKYMVQGESEKALEVVDYLLNLERKAK